MQIRTPLIETHFQVSIITSPIPNFDVDPTMTNALYQTKLIYLTFLITVSSYGFFKNKTLLLMVSDAPHLWH